MRTRLYRTISAVPLTLALLLAAGCDSNKPTPPPQAPSGVLPIKVYVVRDALTEPEDGGYPWTDSQIRQLVNQAIQSNLIVGSNKWIEWNETIIPIDVTWGMHFWAGYIWWVDTISNLQYIRNDYQNGYVPVVFITGLVDASDPNRFMDSYTLDPAWNNDSFWTTHSPSPSPVILISECRVHPNCGDIDGMDGTRKIAPSYQAQKRIVERAIARWLLRQEDYNSSNPNYDNQEYWQGTNPPHSYMSWWNQRVPVPVSQETALNKLNTSPFAP